MIKKNQLCLLPDLFTSIAFVVIITTSLNIHMPLDYGSENRVYHYENAIEVFSKTQ